MKFIDLYKKTVIYEKPLQFSMALVLVIISGSFLVVSIYLYEQNKITTKTEDIINYAAKEEMSNEDKRSILEQETKASSSETKQELTETEKKQILESDTSGGEEKEDLTVIEKMEIIRQ